MLQLFESHGFGQVAVKPSLVGQGLVAVLTPTCLSYDQRVFEHFILAKNAAYLVTVHARQSNIEKDDIWPVTLGGLQGFGTIMRDLEFMSHLFQHQAQHEGEFGVVIDDKDLQGTVAWCLAR